jgi:hypothetical protein
MEKSRQPNPSRKKNNKQFLRNSASSMYRVYNGKIQVKMFFCLIKHYAMVTRTYKRVKLQILKTLAPSDEDECQPEKYQTELTG